MSSATTAPAGAQTARETPYGPDKVRVMHDASAIADRIAAMGAQIARDHTGRDLVLCGVLKGSFVFVADLCRAIPMPCSVEFVGISSYGSRTETSGVVKITQDLSIPVEGKHLLVVEDIVDTGLTMRYLLDNLQTRRPASLRVCTLLHKPARSRVEVQLDYIGFTVPDEFVVGYGLDYDQRYRNLPYIGVLQP